ncbi:MAG: hypothetical protein MI700_10695 [Balneolales bacterium]|nr:hypothetical protein [Balneolales bacterium]
MEYSVLLILHVFLAIVIIGGILVAFLIVLPYARKTNDPDFAFTFIKAFDRGSHAILTIQLLIGFRLGMLYLPISEWFKFETHLSTTMVLKLLFWVLLFASLIIGKKMGLSSPEKGSLKTAAQYFGLLSIFALALMVLGLNFRLVLF